MFFTKSGTSLEAIMALAGFINLIMPMSVAVDANCDYYQDMTLGQPYYIYSPGYPNKYKAGASCRFVGVSPYDTEIVVSCETVDIPVSERCQQDRLSISLTGNINFEDSNNYCGKGTLSLVSKGNKIAVGLVSNWFSSGGRFLCTLTAIKSQNPSNTTTEKPGMCDCGWKKEIRIVGGEETGINEFPSMAGLVNLETRELYCGASLIAAKYAITAAHCLTNRQARNLALLVGDHNINTGADTASAALYILDHLEVHPYFNSQKQENDIAIVKTQNIINFSRNVGPVCLPFRYSNYDFTGFTVTALGWGSIEFSGPKSEYLRKVNLTVVTNQNCQSELTDNTIFNTQICTYDKGKDSCQYDSGGPILWYDYSARRLHLVGLISYGIGCASDFPSVNTRVTSYLAWIVSVTSDAEYCIK
ncbi:hypothetical protein ILUMI_02349 [Ignelater luminosus]|uniref:Venom serine protease 34 n=1 Tax=Ignelater luminosus TaxID=2038154 RepID=A0A8K0GN93_IGNLU|nr:hypothetical protein ILUMI_02349 [Ignelater luminosus]